MADPSIRNPDNASGAWYVDDTCAPCHTCMDIAGPTTAHKLLKYNADETKVFFAVQPSGPEQQNAAQEALEVCPSQAIGNDG